MDTDNNTQHAYPQLRILTEEQLQTLHEASLSVLETTGYEVPTKEARNLLLDAGATAEGRRVRIPRALVEKARETLRVPQMYTRDGSPAFSLKLGEATFGALADTMYLVDPHQGKVRNYTRQDQNWYVAFLDALPNIDWIEVIGQSADVPDLIQTQVAFLESVQRTTKPILFYPYDRQGLLDILEVRDVIAGSREQFCEKPFFICSSVPASPLSGTDYNL